ncbi:MAG: hypothetical protein F9K15_22565 [Zoogloea sp.]|nr:MAG: hypothetical protein F9K15_22565 [Zoogloea sp.]
MGPPISSAFHVPPSLPPIIDIEASGFGSGSYPIEVGVALPDGQTYCSLIRPLAHWTHWDDSAEQVHRVSRDTLLRHGRAAEEVADHVNDLLAGQTVYCDAWYHDLTWLSRLFEATGRVQAFRLDDIRCLLSEAQADHWHATRTRIQADLGLNRHRASNDARILQATLGRVRLDHPTPRRVPGNAQKEIR